MTIASPIVIAFYQVPIDGCNTSLQGGLAFFELAEFIVDFAEFSQNLRFGWLIFTHISCQVGHLNINIQ